MAIIANPIEVKAIGTRAISILFDDGTRGEVDLSHLSGKGIFKKWDTFIPFSSVHINPHNHAVVWDDELEIDSDNLYLTLIGKTFEEWQKEHELEHAAN
jgi:hypothetical protein